MRCVGALLARDEAATDRYLQRTLTNMRTYCDAIVVIDDGSTDATAEICKEHGAEVTTLEQGGWWGKNESAPRALLWNLAAATAGTDGWIYVADADHELVGITPPTFRTLLRAKHVNTWACPLWDCWNSDSTHRVDGYWQAWKFPRVWLAKALPTPDFMPDFGSAAIHAGHLPRNYPLRPGLMPDGAAIRHLGYVQPEHRKQKYQRYLSVAGG